LPAGSKCFPSAAQTAVEEAGAAEEKKDLLCVARGPPVKPSSSYTLTVVLCHRLALRYDARLKCAGASCGLDIRYTV